MVPLVRCRLKIAWPASATRARRHVAAACACCALRSTCPPSSLLSLRGASRVTRPGDHLGDRRTHHCRGRTRNGLSRLVVDFLPVIIFLYAVRPPPRRRRRALDPRVHVAATAHRRVAVRRYAPRSPFNTRSGPPAIRTCGTTSRSPSISLLRRAGHYCRVLWYRAPCSGASSAVDRTLVRGLDDLRALPGVAPLDREPTRLPAPCRAHHAQATKSLGVNLTRVMDSQQYVNKVAAVPSLHAATALLISLFFWREPCGGAGSWLSTRRDGRVPDLSR